MKQAQEPGKRIVSAAGKIVYILGILILLLSPVIFHTVVVPLLGWEFIVGKSNVAYNAAHTRVEAVTNPGGWLGWWVLIGIVGYAIMLFGKKMQRRGAHTISRTDED